MKHHFTIAFVILLATALLCGCSAAAEPVVADVQAASQTSQTDLEAAASLILDIPTTQYFTDEAIDPDDMDTILLAGTNAPSAMNGQPWHFSAITDSAVIEEISGGMSFGGPPAGMTDLPEGAEPPADLKEQPEGMPENMPQMPEDGQMPKDFATPDGEKPAEAGNRPEGDFGDMPAPPTGTGAVKAGIEDAPLVIVVSCKEGSEFDAGLACQNMSVEAQLLGYGTKIVSAPTMAINAQGQEALREKLGIPEGYTACALLLVGMEDHGIDTTADTYASATARNPLSDTVTYLNP